MSVKLLVVFNFLKIHFSASSIKVKVLQKFGSVKKLPDKEKKGRTKFLKTNFKSGGKKEQDEGW